MSEITSSAYRGVGIERLEDRTLFSAYTASSVTGLITAINAANCTAAADTITLTLGKTFTLSAVNNRLHGPTGLPVITAPLTIVGNGCVIQRSTAVGTPLFRLLDVNPGVSLVLKKLTLRNGDATLIGSAATAAPETKPHGGAILNQGNLTMASVTLSNNKAVNGGAIYSTGALTMTSCTVRGNSAIGGMGSSALSSMGTPTLGGAGGWARGGGVYISSGTASITGSTFADNSARGGRGLAGIPATPITIGGKTWTPGPDGGSAAGGGLCVMGGSVTVRTSSFTNNLALGAYGASQLPPLKSGYSGNAYGGGIDANGGTLTLRDVKASGNTAAGATTWDIYTTGRGYGGGLRVSTTATANLNQFTLNHITLNYSEGHYGNPNIYGVYNLIV